MAKKTVELDIKVTGTDQITDVNQALEKTSIDAAKVAESTIKLTKGIAGGFELASQAAGVFGEKTGKAFEETVQRATQYIALSNSLKDVAEGFSKENIKGLTAIFKGFTKAGIGAKLFGTVTASAITATGIGALVVLLGLLIANWDKVTDAVGGFIDSIPFLKSIKDTINELVESVGSLSNLFKGIGAFIKGVFTAGTSAVEEFNKAIESGKVQEALIKQADLIKLANEERARSLKLLEAQGASQEKILALQKEIASTELKNLQDRKTAGEELSEENEKRIKDLELEIDLIDIKAGKAIEAARKEAFFKKNDAIRAEMERAEEFQKLQKEEQEQRLKEFDETNKKIIESWKETAFKLEEITIDIEQETTDKVEGLTAKRTAAILDIQEKLRTNAAKKFTDSLLAEEIKFLEEKRDLTVEEEELLNELKAEKRAEDFENIMQYVEQAADTINQISSVITENIQKNIEGIQFQIDAVTTQFQESVANRESLEAQLADAQGARRAQLLASIEEEKAKEKSLADERKKLQNEQIKAQNKANNIEYANAVIQSSILTAKAILTALSSAPPPANAVLAAISAALAAVQTGIVIANKPKTIPTFASGGFTEGLGYTDHTGHEVAGVVHGNEYVVPARVLNSDSGYRMVAALEAMRQGKPSFADGGATTPNISAPETSSGTEALMAALRGLNLSVAVTEINQVSNRVAVIENRASLG